MDPVLNAPVIFKVADERIQVAQKKQKEQYKKRKGVVDYQFKEGDKVLRRNMKQKTRKGSKGEDRWLGPYTIVELSATTCILKNALGKKLKTRINLSQLKPYLQASQSDNKHADPTESDNELTSQSEPDEPSDNESENETKADPAEDDLRDSEPNQPADPAEDDLPDSEPNQPDPRCKCKTRCSTRKCPCRAQEHACGHLCHPGRTCANTCNADEPKELIDLTKAELQAQPSDNLWIAVGETKLSVEDRNVLESQDWLSDKHIHAALQLLKKQHPQVTGLQNILQCTSTFDIQGRNEFIQCLNLGGNH